MRANTQYIGTNGKQNFMWPLDSMWITQKEGGSYSHKGTYALDNQGYSESTGQRVYQQPYYAPCDCRLVKRYGSSSPSLVWVSTVEVNFIDGTSGYACFAFTHDDDTMSFTIGETRRQGELIGHTGTYGKVTGDHVHIEVKKGGYDGYRQNSYGNWMLKNSTHVYSLMGVDDVAIKDDKGYNFQEFGNSGSSLLRHGTYGYYYGNLTNGSQPLTQGQMELNAEYIYKALTHEGWSLSAICGMLGNMQYESSINPGRWQSDDVGNTSMGYGLVQWTPATKYINWVGSGKDYSTMDNNLARIEYEVSNNIQYIASTSYPTPSTFREYTLSPLNPYFLACVFAWNYERSYVVLYGTEEEKEALRQQRGGAANYWYEYLSGVDPGPGPSPEENKKRKGYNFVLFNRRRRIGHG
jgi:hypothetical protein